MATSFVELNKNGFWIPDWLLQVWLLFLAREINKLPKKDEAILALRNNWYLEGMHICVGCMRANLEEFVQDENRKTIILKLIDNVLSNVRSNPSILTHIEINNLIMAVAEELKSIDARWNDSQIERVRNNELLQKDVEQAAVVRTGELFRELLEGKIQTTAKSEVNYWPWSKT